MDKDPDDAPVVMIAAPGLAITGGCQRGASEGTYVAYLMPRARMEHRGTC